LPPPASQVQLKDLTVTLTNDLSTSAASSTAATVTDGGKPVTDLQPAHGAFGHAVVIRPDDLGYLHMHPTSQASGPRLDFLGSVPGSGYYRLFIDFYRDDKPYVAAFTVQATK
jgi:hypothetical protein